jgi:signal transduction histidine kinase
MHSVGENSETGMEMRDLLNDNAFRFRHPRIRPQTQNRFAVFHQLAEVFNGKPEVLLQKLVEIAVEFCGADSSGISLEEPNESGDLHFRWVAIAGSFSQFLNGTTPRFFSPCGTTLERNMPQLYRVTERYYDYLGIEAEPIADGILIPWVVDNVRGTIWAVSHRSREAFDFQDYQLLDGVAEFVAIAIRQQNAFRQKQELALNAALANELAHQINNPLQSVTNAIYIAEHASNPRQYVKVAARELQRVTELVKKLLTLRNVA